MIWTQPKQFVPVQKIWTVQRTRHYSSKEMNTSADLFFEILVDDLKVYIQVIETVCETYDLQ